MAFSPVAFIAPNYRDYKNYWLKFYEVGTTTPKAIALEADGGTQVSKLQLSPDGFIISAGSAIVMPYVDSYYDGFLFPTEAEADANDTVNAIRVADNLIGVNGVGSPIQVNDLSGAISSTSATDGDYVCISDRGYGLFQYQSGKTPDGFGVIATDNPALSLVLVESSGELNVLWVGAKADSTDGTDGTDSTAAIQFARDTKRPLYFPASDTGGYRITGQILGNKNDPEWRGDGWRADQPESGTVIYLDGDLGTIETANAQGKIKVTGTPFISPSPLILKDLTFNGIDNTGIGIELGVDAEFFGLGEWSSVQVRKCGLAINANNLFLTSWKHVVIRNNKRGVQIQPTDNIGPDDGYFTTWSWSDCYIGFNEGFGVSINTPLGNKNFSWRNTSVESNCLSLDKTEGQISSYNARINTISCYFERTDDTPYYCGYGGVNWLEHEDPHVQETMGVKTEAGAFAYRHRGGQMVNSSDKVFDVATNNQQSFYFERANLDSSHSLYANFDGTYKMSGFDTFGADGLFTFNGVKADTQITGQSADKATSLRRTRVYRKDLSGITINAGQRLTLVQDQGDASTSVTTTAECKIYGLNPGGAVANLFLQYSQGTTSNDSVWSVQVVNHGGGNYDLTGAYLLIAQHYWTSSEIIDI